MPLRLIFPNEACAYGDRRPVQLAHTMASTLCPYEAESSSGLCPSDRRGARARAGGPLQYCRDIWSVYHTPYFTLCDYKALQNERVQ